MTLHWSGALGVAAWVAMWALSVFVFLAGSDRALNRRLALLLLMVGVDIGTSGPGLVALDWVEARPDVRYGVWALHFVIDATLPPLYLLFLASAFSSPITRILARPRATGLLWTAAAAGPAVVLWRMDDLAGTGDLLGAASEAGDLLPFLFGYVTGGFLLAFAIALHAFLRSGPGLSRDRLRTYLLAFGTLDVTWSMTFIISALHVRSGGAPPGGGPLLYAGGTLVFGLLLSYAVLRHQLLGIDVKVKWTVKQSTVAAVFIGLFFVVSEAAAAFFSDRVGTYMGIIAAGALVFAVAPLQHFAQRVADRAMPGVKAVGEMTDDERADAYREMLRLAWANGAVDKSERAMLQGMREKLGLTAEHAERIEREVVSS